MPHYEWSCHACTAPNPAGTDACFVCACRAHATCLEIDARRESLRRGVVSAGPQAQADIFDARPAPDSKPRGAMSEVPRMVFAVLAIACGVWGFSFTLALAAQRLQPSWIYALVLVIAATYVLGVWSGVALLERSGRWLLLNRIFWFLQVPALAALLAEHSIDSGALVSDIGVSAWLAQRSDFSLIRDMPVVLGLNLFALAVCGYFCWVREGGTQASTAMKPEARA